MYSHSPTLSTYIHYIYVFSHIFIDCVCIASEIHHKFILHTDTQILYVKQMLIFFKAINL